MSTTFSCCICGDAAVTALVYEDGSERMYCPSHIHGQNEADPLSATVIDRPLQPYLEPILEARTAQPA